MKELQEMIRGVCALHPPGKERTRALKAVQWRLRGRNGEFVGLGGLETGFACRFVPETEAQVFDGRDNEATKMQVYSAALGFLSVEILPQVVTGKGEL